MKQKKNKLLIIAIIIGVVLIVFLSLVYAYVATDIFKSDKELFFKYMSEIVDEENGLFDSDLKQYFEKQKNSPYTNKGTITTEITGLDEIAPQLEKAKNTNITFSGKTDNTSSKKEQEISINYSDDINFLFSVKKVQDEVGMQTEYVGSKYIYTNVNQLSNLNTSLQIATNYQNSAKLVNVSKGNIVEEIKQIKDKYIDIIKQNSEDTNCTKIEENGQTGYKLNVNSKELVKLLEGLKDDQATIDKINEYIKIINESTIIQVENINDLIEKLNSNNENNNVEITIYRSNEQISKIQIKSEQINIVIEKNKNENELQYKISLEKLKQQQRETLIELNVKYEGLASLQNIIETYELSIQTTAGEVGDISCKYNISNNINFEQESNIQEFTAENSVNLDSLQEEQKNTFIESVDQRLIETNNKQMEALGNTEDENLLEYINPMTYLSFALFNTSQSKILGGVSEIEEAEIANYNAKFELYQGTNIAGVTVKGLMTTIAENNGLNDDEDEEENQTTNNKKNLIQQIHFNGEEYEVNKQTIALLKEEIVAEDSFRVEFERDENTGRIYRVVINKR